MSVNNDMENLNPYVNTKYKYALVTGSTRGIGKYIAKVLLEQGFYVILNYAHDDNAAQNTAEQFDEYHDRFNIIKQELSSYEAAVEFADKVQNITNSLTYVVFNCGSTDRSSFSDITKDSWQYVMNTNLNVPFYLLQKLDGLLVDNGSILFIGSIMGIYPHATSLAYNVSKAGVHALSKSLVKEYKNRKIRVNTIAPGFTDTDWQSSKTEEIKKKITDNIALHRFAKPDEIADLACCVLKNEYINGGIYEISGGYCFK